jgi:nucleoside-diphosphate kinase
LNWQVVIDYADEGTKLHCAAHGMRLFGLVKPGALGALPAVLTAAQQTFTISRLKMIDLDAEGGRRFNCAPGPAVAIEASLLGASSDVAQRWADFVASQGRAMAGTQSAGDTSSDDAVFCFEAPASVGDARGAATACLVKPHVVAESRLGELVGAIQALGFQIEALQMVTLGTDTATAFLDVYKGVLPHYAQTVAHVTEGPSVFLKLRGQGPNVVADFRDACGPCEVELAKLLRPASLRALFGADHVRNALHCTDLPEDGALEVGYFLHLLSL